MQVHGLQANRLLQLLPGLSISWAENRAGNRFGYPANGLESFHVVLLGYEYSRVLLGAWQLHIFLCLNSLNHTKAEWSLL
jgi:hypothetical protein